MVQATFASASRRVCIIVIALGLLLAGCGGAGPHGASSSTSGGSGSAVFTVIWPSSTRLIPNATLGITVAISYGGKTLAQTTLSRPSDTTTSTTATFNNLPAAQLQVAVSAYPTATPHRSDVAQATGQGTLTIKSNLTSGVTVSLVSTVSNLTLTPSVAGSLLTGQSETISVSATDSKGRMVLLSTSAGSDPIAWTSSQPSSVAVSGAAETGTVNAKTNGDATVTATMTTSDSGTTVSNSLHVHVGPVVYLLAKGGFPKSMGDLANTGRAQVSKQATGSISWSTSIGNSDVTALIVGPDETIYAAGPSSVTALDSTGKKKWSASATNTYGLFLAQNGQLLAAGSNLTSIDSATGEILWTYQTDSDCFAPTASPDGKTLYITTAKSLTAIDSTSLATKWKFAPQRQSSSPVTIAGDGTLGYSSLSSGSGTSQTQYLSLLNPADGSIIKELTTTFQGDPFGVPASGTAVCADQNSFYYVQPQTQPSSSESLDLFNCSTSGQVNWTQVQPAFSEAGEAFLSFISLSPGGTLVSTNQVYQSLNPAAGYCYSVPKGGTSLNQLLGQSAVGATFNSEGLAFLVGSGGAPANLICMNPETGATVWTVDLGLLYSDVAPAIGPSGTVYVGAPLGTVMAIH